MEQELAARGVQVTKLLRHLEPDLPMRRLLDLLPAARPSPPGPARSAHRIAISLIGLALIVTATTPPASAQQPDTLPIGSEPVIRWSPATPMEGTLFTVRVEGLASENDIEAHFAGQPLSFHRRGDALVAMAAAPLDSAGVRTLSVSVDGADSAAAREYEVPVAPGTYTLQRLTVAPAFGSPQPPELQRRIEAEAARAMAVSRSSHETPRMWEAPFLAPRESRITSGFGHGRTFNGEVRSRHTGTDYAGAAGTPIVAPSRGRVALVDSFYLGGRVIYIDHGAGLVTAYLHLSEQLVAEGDVVERGDTIGRIGATGRVTGPHLHWIVRYGPHSVDGESLLDWSEGLTD